MATQAPPGIPVSTLNPKYLHSNSTSHTWPFGAIAELIDNAYDPDVNAKQFWINKTVIRNEDCLIFMDNGNGMDYETMHKMLSFGYSDKVAKAGKAPIGMYGNGFKSGSMRLGKDAIVFSKSKNVRCVGMLSQTYLQEIQAQQIIVPIVCFEKSGSNKFIVSDEHKASLQDILQYSPFKTQEELLLEIEAITSTGRSTGTRIVIWNLRRSSNGTLELDFETDQYDVRLPQDGSEDTTDNLRSPVVKSHVPDINYSLRAYCKILYLKPRMQVVIRGEKVKSEFIAKSLAHTRKDSYNPLFLKKPVPITFGYNTRSKEQFGVMMYHKNRLIKAYERVGCQLRAQSRGVGVIAIIECDFLDPMHNKQSFMESDKYKKTINSLGIKLEEYWNEIRYKKKTENPNNEVAVEDTIERPDQNWVQCDTCQKWRKLPDGVDCKRLPDMWYCRLNPDPQFRNCEVDEDPEHLEDEQPYRKTYKQQQKDKKTKKKQETPETNHLPQVINEAAAANKTLDGDSDMLRRTLFGKSENSPRTPTTTGTNVVEKKTINSRSPALVWLPVSNAVCSPSSQNVSLIITDIRSLATPPQGQKRPQKDQTQTSSKKPKVMARPEASAPEKAAALNPQVLNLNLNKVKEERKESIMENGNSEAAAGDLAESNTGVNNTTTQTFVRVKEENLSQPETNVRPRSIDRPPNFSLHQTPGTVKMQTEIAPPFSIPPPPIQDDDTKYNICAICSKNSSISPLQQFERQLKKVTQEKNSLEEKVQMLTRQLQEAQATLQAASPPSVEQPCSSLQARPDYKGLYEKAQQRVDESVKDQEALQAAAGSKPTEVQCPDDASMQIDCLLIELDECRIKRDEVLSECEQLKLKLKQAEVAQNGATVSPHVGPGKNRMPAEALLKSLRNLRQNVARLLIKHVPVLELNRVDYDCPVIDKILEQYLES